MFLMPIKNSNLWTLEGGSAKTQQNLTQKTSKELLDAIQKDKKIDWKDLSQLTELSERLDIDQSKITEATKNALTGSLEQMLENGFSVNDKNDYKAFKKVLTMLWKENIVVLPKFKKLISEIKDRLWSDYLTEGLSLVLNNDTIEVYWKNKWSKLAFTMTQNWYENWTFDFLATDHSYNNNKLELDDITLNWIKLGDERDALKEINVAILDGSINSIEKQLIETQSLKVIDANLSALSTLRNNIKYMWGETWKKTKLTTKIWTIIDTAIAKKLNIVPEPSFNFMPTAVAADLVPETVIATEQVEQVEQLTKQVDNIISNIIKLIKTLNEQKLEIEKYTRISQLNSLLLDLDTFWDGLNQIWDLLDWDKLNSITEKKQELINKKAEFESLMQEVSELANVKITKLEAVNQQAKAKKQQQAWSNFISSALETKKTHWEKSEYLLNTNDSIFEINFDSYHATIDNLIIKDNEAFVQKFILDNWLNLWGGSNTQFEKFKEVFWIDNDKLNIFINKQFNKYIETELYKYVDPNNPSAQKAYLETRIESLAINESVSNILNIGEYKARIIWKITELKIVIDKKAKKEKPKSQAAKQTQVVEEQATEANFMEKVEETLYWKTDKVELIDGKEANIYFGNEWNRHWLELQVPGLWNDIWHNFDWKPTYDQKEEAVSNIIKKYNEKHQENRPEAEVTVWELTEREESINWTTEIDKAIKEVEKYDNYITAELWTKEINGHKVIAELVKEVDSFSGVAKYKVKLNTPTWDWVWDSEVTEPIKNLDTQTIINTMDLIGKKYQELTKEK